MDLVNTGVTSGSFAMTRVQVYGSSLNGPQTNVKLTSGTSSLTAATSINALLLVGSGITADLSAKRLTINSGVLVNSGGSNTIQSSGTNANVYFGPSGSPVDLLIYTEPGSTLTQASSAPFVSNQVMQKLHTGTLILSANNSGLTGGTDYVDQGNLDGPQ